MAKQTVGFNFSKGINSKDDPWQLSTGQFEKLENMVFQRGSLLTKRNGYGLISHGPASNYLTTLNDNLVSIGSTVNAYSESLKKWITKGSLQPSSLSVLPLIRNNFNQVQVDSVVANGFVLTTYTQNHQTVSSDVNNYLFAIADSTTGQNIVEPSLIPVISGGTISGSSRVFVVGNYFVIVSQVIVSTTNFLQYVSIPLNNPVNLTTNLPVVSAAQQVTSQAYIPTTSNPGWDAVSINNSSENILVVGYNTTSGGQSVHVASLTQAQISNQLVTSTIRSWTDPTYIGSIMSMCVDLTVSPNVIYVSFWNSTTSNGFTAACSLALNSIIQVFSPRQIITGISTANLASCAQNNQCVIFGETINAYSFDSTVPTNFIEAYPIDVTGTVGAPYGVIRSVGLASKAAIVNGTIYFLSSFQSTFQPGYFLINGSLSRSASPIVVSRLGSLNGGGYVSLGLPQVNVVGSVLRLPYLFKDDVEALNTLNNTQQTTAGGIYSQLGINLATFDVETNDIDTVEATQNLQISGGYLGNFDGYLPVENNFFLWPEPIKVTYTASSTVTPTGTTTSGSSVITAVSSVTGVSPGMTITGGGIPAGAYVVLVGTTTLTISVSATANNTAETLTIQGNIAAVPTGGTMGTQNYGYQVTYEWSDNQGLAYRSTPSIPVLVTTSGTGVIGSVRIDVPTLRLTYKTANPVKIVIYRWSVETQVYNQVTSIVAPVLNSTTVDSVFFIDNLPDSQVVGNNILYTTGGVVPNTNGPANNGIMTLFDDALWVVDAENPNNLWRSKTILPGAPIDMSLDFTIYVSPTTGTIGSLGPITALAPMDDKLIIFFKQGIYYINGSGPNDLGTTAVGCSLGNYTQPIFVTSIVGSTNQKSIVQTADGLQFQSDKGIWLLNRKLLTSYIGAPVEAYNQSIANSANVIPQTNHILFTLDTGEMLMYDYYYQQWGTFQGVKALSSCIYQGLHTVIDQYGNILQQTPGKYVDNSSPVLMKLISSWLNLAGLQGYQRFYEFYILAKYLSPHSLRCQVSYNYNSSPAQQEIITPQNFSPTSPSPYGAPTPYGSVSNVENWRIHAKQQLCESFQLTIEEIFNPLLGTDPGAGFTMSGISCEIEIKKSTRPIPGRTTAGMS